MNKSQCKQYIHGAIATIPTAFDAKFNIDFGRMSELTKWWVSQGLGTSYFPLKVAAAMGEGPFMSPDEWPILLQTVVNAAGPEANILCALQIRDTLHTIEDAKKAQDLGAKGLQISLPFMAHPTQDDCYRFFSDISEKIDIGIMIYNTYWFGCEPISVQTMQKLSKNTEHVVAIKWAVPEDSNPSFPAYDDMSEFSADINVIDNSSQPARCHKLGGKGFISSLICAYPEAIIKCWNLLEAKKYSEFQAIWDNVEAPIREWRNKNSELSGAYRGVKGVMDAIGKYVGPSRPPTLGLNPLELSELQALVKKHGFPIYN